RTIAKIGFDATAPYGVPETLENTRPRPPQVRNAPPARFQTVAGALEDGPKHFLDMVLATGSRDGREVALALDALREAGRVSRLENGAWALGTPEGAAAPKPYE